MNVTQICVLADKIRKLKCSPRHSKPIPKVRPELLPEERDTIVTALQLLATSIAEGITS